MHVDKLAPHILPQSTCRIGVGKPLTLKHPASPPRPALDTLQDIHEDWHSSATVLLILPAPTYQRAILIKRWGLAGQDAAAAGRAGFGGPLHTSRRGPVDVLDAPGLQAKAAAIQRR